MINLFPLLTKCLKTQKQFHSAKTENDKEIYQKKIDLLDNQIDKLVFELYELTEEDIKIMEEG